MAVYEHLAPVSGAVAQAMLHEQIQAVEHVLYRFCQPAYLRYHLQLPGVLLPTPETEPTHLRYIHRETVIDMPLIERDSLQHRLELFRYLASPFYNCSTTIRGGRLPIEPSASACEQLRICFESLLADTDTTKLHLWARHINVIAAPSVTWSEFGGLERYELSGYRSACPSNLFQVFAAGDAPIGIHAPRLSMTPEMEATTLHWSPPETRQNRGVCLSRSRLRQALEQISNYRYPDDPPRDSETDAFIAEINALMAEEEDTELPPEGTLPKSAPTG